LGSLLRIGGALAVGTTALVVAYRKFSGGLEEATERLKESNAAMRAGIAEAKIYGSRLRALKSQLGLVTAAEMERRAAEEGALDLMGERAVRNNEEIQQLSALRTAQNQNIRLLEQTQRGIIQVAGARHTLETVTNDLVGTTEQETIELRGQAALIETAGNNWQEYSNAVAAANMTGNFAADNALKIQLAHEHLNEETAKTIESNIRIAEKIEFLDRSTSAYNETLDKNQAMIAITNAIQSGNVDSMIRARASLEDLDEAQRATASATLENAIAAEKQVAAAERAAAAAERERAELAKLNEQEQENIQTETMRGQALDLLATAQGEAAVLTRQYQQEMAAINELVEQGAFESQAEQMAVSQAALMRYQAALKELKQAEIDEAQTAIDTANEKTALIVSQKDQITASFNAQISELESMRETDLANAEAYTAKIEELEDQKNAAVFEAQRNAAAQTMQTAAMVGNTVSNTVSSFSKMMLQDLANQEAEALAAAGENTEKQEKIREEFEKKRKEEMARVFKIQKGVEIANVGINAASASIAALGPPPTGLGPVLGPALIPFIAASAAAQIATIASQKPAFHQGGIVGGQGDQMIKAQGGEVVLSRSAVAQMGGAQAANELNRGQPGPGGPVVVQMTYRNRMFDQVVVDNLAKGGPLKNALNRATNRGKRGRIGGRL